MAQRSADGTLLMVDGAASIVVDERCHPVIVTTWFGQATVGLVDQYYGWIGPRLRRARASGERLVLLNDTFATERPTPMVRARLAEQTKAQSKEDGKAMIASVVIIESAMVRGAVTALGWILPSLSDTDFVGTMDEGIARCLSIAEKAGLQRPTGLTSYVRPRRP